MATEITTENFLAVAGKAFASLSSASINVQRCLEVAVDMWFQNRPDDTNVIETLTNVLGVAEKKLKLGKESVHYNSVKLWIEKVGFRVSDTGIVRTKTGLEYDGEWRAAVDAVPSWEVVGKAAQDAKPVENPLEKARAAFAMYSLASGVAPEELLKDFAKMVRASMSDPKVKARFEKKRDKCEEKGIPVVAE
jgi:hypothetical protein